MNKVRNLFVLLFLGSMVGCNAVDGTMQILQSFSYVNNASDTMIEFCKTHPTDYYCKGIDTANKSVTFAPGNYHARLDFPSNRQVNITMDYKTPSSNQVTLQFTLPEGQSFPSTSGEVFIPSNQIGQAYDMKGNVDSQYSDTQPQRGTESCTVPETHRECHWERNSDGRGGHQVCQDVTEYRSGTQEVEYYYHDTTTNFSVGLFTPNTANTLAQFAGTTYQNDKIYTYQGPCILN